MMKEVLDKKRRQEDEEKLAKVVLLEAFLKQLKEKHESVSIAKPYAFQDGH